MYFSDIVEELGTGRWEINEKNQMIYEISKSPLKIDFFVESTKIICNENEFDVKYSDFSKFSFKDYENTVSETSSVLMSKLLYEDTELFELKEEKMQSFKELVQKLNQFFDDDKECTPKAQVEYMIDLCSLNEVSKFNLNLFKLLLIYKKRMENACNEGFLLENSKILAIMEEDSGKIAANLVETAKKGFGKALAGGFSGFLSAGYNIAKAAGGRIAKGIVNDVAEAKTIAILTDKNVILATQGEINVYDFDDASEIFQARQDETLAGVVDVYDDCENLIINNLSQTQWNVFKTLLRKLKKEAEQTAMEPPSVDSGDDEFAEVEKKITKLKKLLDNGLISQEDFDSKKAEILSSI